MLGGSTIRPEVEIDLLGDYTRGIEYDFLTWVADASWIKLQQAALGSPDYIERATHKEIIIDYLHQMEEVLYAEWQLEQIYTNPEIPNPELTSKDLRERLDILYTEQSQLAPLSV